MPRNLLGRDALARLLGLDRGYSSRKHGSSYVWDMAIMVDNHADLLLCEKLCCRLMFVERRNGIFCTLSYLCPFAYSTLNLYWETFFLSLFYLYNNSKDLRAIPEAEIGLAVIFMSTEKYCNPQKQPGDKGNWKKSSHKLTALKRQYFFLYRSING